MTSDYQYLAAIVAHSTKPTMTPYAKPTSSSSSLRKLGATPRVCRRDSILGPLCSSALLGVPPALAYTHPARAIASLSRAA